MQEIAVGRAEVLYDCGRCADGLGLGREAAGDFTGLLLLHGLELLLQILLLGEQRLDLLLQFAHGRVDLAGDGLDELQLLVRPLVSLQAGDGFDAPDAGGDG